jgi:hypothetical protein
MCVDLLEFSMSETMFDRFFAIVGFPHLISGAVRLSRGDDDPIQPVSCNRFRQQRSRPGQAETPTVTMVVVTPRQLNPAGFPGNSYDLQSRFMNLRITKFLEKLFD